MKPYDCLLIRVSGELSLKSEQVKPRFFSKLVSNVRKALDRKNIKHKIETNPSRIFVYTEDIKNALRSAIKVFGINSISPAWTCFSDLDEMKVLVTDIAIENLKLDSSKSFALRVRKAGRHKKFSLRMIAEEVGAAVKRTTNASVNLNTPDVEIFIECRSRRTYVFVKKYKGVGGLPLGTGGRALALVYAPEDVVASWFIMRRGVELSVLTDNEEYEQILRSWHIGGRMKVKYMSFEEAKEYAKKMKHPIVKGSVSSQLLPFSNYPVFNPIVCFSKKKVEKMYEKIKKFSKPL